MSRRLVLCTFAVVIGLTGGCNLFRKSRQPKESSAISSEVEENFRRRWVDKRVSDLTAGGVAAEAARTQAETEFRERYDFSRPGAK